MQCCRPGDGAQRVVRGETNPSASSVMAAIFLASSSPPHWQMSGCRMLTTCASTTETNSDRSIRRSPAAMGIAVRDASAASPATSPGGTDSSTNFGREGFSALMKHSATPAVGGRPWKIDHDLDAVANSGAKVRHHPFHLVHITRRRIEMRIGNDHALKALQPISMTSLDQRARFH